MPRKESLQEYLSRPSFPHGWRKEILQLFSVEELIAHLRSAKDERTKSLLITVFGFEHVYQAADCIAEFFDDESSKVRYEAADMLAHLTEGLDKDQMKKYCNLLHKVYLLEKHFGTKKMQLVALGALKYEPIVDECIARLTDEDEGMRGSAAWSLGNIADARALAPLKQALSTETGWYPQQNMTKAIEILSTK